MNSDYGPLAELVASAGCLMSAAGALALGWKRRAAWEPVEDDVPRAPQRVGGLLSALGIGLLWGNREHLSSLSLSYTAAGVAVVCVVALLCYILLVTTFVYTRKVATGPREVREDKIIGGFAVLPNVRPHLIGERARTIQQILATRQHDPDTVWPRHSRGIAKVCFVLAYLGLSTGGTVALAAVALLLGRSVPS